MDTQAVPSPGPQEMDAFAWVGIGAFQKHADAHHLEVIERDDRGRGPRFWQLFAAQQNVYVLGRANGLGFLGRHPQCDGLAADQGVSDPRLFQGLRNSLQPVGHILKGHKIALPNLIVNMLRFN